MTTKILLILAILLNYAALIYGLVIVDYRIIITSIGFAALWSWVLFTEKKCE